MAKRGRIFVIIFLALLIPVLLAAPESEAKVYRGKYANNTKWSYNTKTKTVTIECRGELPDDSNGSAGWRDYYLKAKKVIFKKGITSIGAGAFDNFQKLEEVVLPEGLTLPLSILPSAITPLFPGKPIHRAASILSALIS